MPGVNPRPHAVTTSVTVAGRRFAVRSIGSAPASVMLVAAAGAGHQIALERPDLVVDTVLALVRSANTAD
jgi:hypothetical protein